MSHRQEIWLCSFLRRENIYLFERCLKSLRAQSLQARVHVAICGEMAQEGAALAGEIFKGADCGIWAWDERYSQFDLIYLLFCALAGHDGAEAEDDHVWISFCDDDDEYARDRISTQDSWITRYPDKNFSCYMNATTRRDFGCWCVKRATLRSFFNLYSQAKYEDGLRAGPTDLPFNLWAQRQHEVIPIGLYYYRQSMTDSKAWTQKRADGSPWCVAILPFQPPHVVRRALAQVKGNIGAPTSTVRQEIWLCIILDPLLIEGFHRLCLTARSLREQETKVPIRVAIAGKEAMRALEMVREELGDLVCAGVASTEEPASGVYGLIETLNASAPSSEETAQVWVSLCGEGDVYARGRMTRQAERIGQGVWMTKSIRCNADGDPSTIASWCIQRDCIDAFFKARQGETYPSVNRAAFDNYMERADMFTMVDGLYEHLKEWRFWERAN